MAARPTPATGRRSTRRRPSRFHATVEALDPRRLLATGVTGQVVGLGGIIGVSVGFYNSELTGLPTDDTNPVPLVRLRSTGPALTPATVSATVDYGDGSGVAPAATTTLGTTSSDLLVRGPDHTYTTPGTYTITIAVVEPGDTSATIFQDPITIRPPAIYVTGNLVVNGANVGLVAGMDEATNAVRPTFDGLTQAGATVTLTATNLAYPSVNLVVGAGVADATGRYSISTVPLIDGRYTIAAVATGQFGASAAAFLAGPFDNFLRVDTAGPHVTSFQVTNARTGTVAIGFDDPYGLNLTPLTQSSSYVVTRTSPAPRRGQTFALTNLTTSVAAPGTSPYVDVPVVVTGQLTSNFKPITQNGTYTLTIPSAAIFSLGGATLDGEYTGKFPTGNGQAGGNFRVKITVRNGKASGPIAIAAVKAEAVQPHAAPQGSGTK